MKIMCGLDDLAAAVPVMKTTTIVTMQAATLCIAIVVDFWWPGNNSGISGENILLPIRLNSI